MSTKGTHSSISNRPEVTAGTGGSASVTFAEPVGSELAISAGQTRFSDAQVAALRQIGVEDATQPDLDVFFHIAARSGLDPFAKQIYMIPRETDVRVRIELPNGNSRVEKQRVTKFTVQTGIDGFRVIGRRAAKREGVLVSNDDPLWRGKDTEWQDFWDKSDGYPIAAKYTLRGDGAPNPATCMFDEFCQYTGQGELNSFWKKMPANQLIKCAEAVAWRKLFPHDFAGIELEGSHQVIDPDGTPVQVPSRARGVEGLRDAITDRPVDEPDIVIPGGSIGFTPVERRKGLNMMFALFADADIGKDNRDDRLLITGEIIGETVASSNDLTDPQLYTLVNTLRMWKGQGKLAENVTDILELNAIERARQAEQDDDGDQ